MSYIGGNFTFGSSNAGDLRAKGWDVAIHNDYRLHGVRHTFWLLTRKLKCGMTVAVVGEGDDDDDALDKIRQHIMDRLERFEALDVEYLFTTGVLGKKT